MIESPYQLMAYDTAEETAFEGEVLAFERQPAVSSCPLRRESNPPHAPEDAPLKHVHATVFFDGTGNSMLSDGDHETNVVKLFDLHRVGWDAATETVNAALYVRGVGTLNTADDGGALRLSRAEDQSARRMEELTGAYGTLPRVSGGGGRSTRTSTYGRTGALDEYASDGTDMLGSAFGYGMDIRINEACRWVLEKAAEATPRTGMVTVNSIGFSRGAAECRSFWNRVYERVKPQIEGRNTFRFNFLGLFDTVASIGWSGGGTDDTPGHNIVLAADRVTAMSTTVFHCIARDEFRANFRFNPTNVSGADHVYTGCHSDIGGGYTEVPSPDPRASGGDAAAGDDSQGRHNTLPLVTLVDMHRQAVQAGLPLDRLRPAIVRRANQLSHQAQAFYASRRDVWAMAMDLHKDCAYATVTDAEVRNWYVDNRASDDLRQNLRDVSGVGSMMTHPGSSTDVVEADPGFQTFNTAANFWRQYIHLPYYQRWTFGSGPRETAGTTVSALGMAMDDYAHAPEFNRSRAVHYERTAPTAGDLYGRD